MDLNLNRKIIIVTGGASGIGEAIVIALAQEGAVPVIVDQSEDNGKSLEDSVRSSGKECLFIQTHLTDPKACKQVVTTTLNVFGYIHGLVNNAGVNDGVGLAAGPEAFSRSIAANLLHYYDLVHFALEALKQTRGCIVNVASKTAITGQGGTSGYSASKGGQLALTREWAVELAPFGIRVNALLPAEVMTPMYETWIQQFPEPEKKLREISGRIPLGQRMTTPQEIADMAIFLLSDRSAHTTGQWIHVDGGYVHLDRATGLKEESGPDSK